MILVRTGHNNEGKPTRFYTVVLKDERVFETLVDDTGWKDADVSGRMNLMGNAMVRAGVPKESVVEFLTRQARTARAVTRRAGS